MNMSRQTWRLGTTVGHCASDWFGGADPKSPREFKKVSSSSPSRTYPLHMPTCPGRVVILAATGNRSYSQY